MAIDNPLVTSNDTLQHQFEESLKTVEFYLLLLALFTLISWLIYLTFYNSRVLGLLISTILRHFIKTSYLKIGSVSISVLSGKIMVRDFHWVTDDYTIRLHDAIIIFNFWTTYNPNEKVEEQQRCLRVQVFGMELHVYNQAQVYDDLRTLFASYRPVPPPDPGGKKKEASPGDPAEIAVVTEASKEGDEAEEASKKPAEFNDKGWWNWRDLVPLVKVEVEQGKICCGNHLLPNALCMSWEKAQIQYCTRDATYSVDRFQHHIECDYSMIIVTLVPITKYSGHYVAEDPPRNYGDGFKVFQLGKGKITYFMDEPGLVSLEPERVHMSDGNVSVRRTYPEWKLDIQVTKDCQINYGPWADKQREILWKFFFPTNFEGMQVTPEPQTGAPRLHRKLTVVMHADTNTQIEVMFTKDGVNQVIHLEAAPGSYFKTAIPWIVRENGYTTVVRGTLLMVDGTATHLCRNMLKCQILEFLIRADYPRVWNAHQRWTCLFEVKNARLNLIFDHKRFFKAMVEEWVRGSKPDMLSFVPFTYNVIIKAKDFELATMANDYNWIAPTSENAHLSFFVTDFNMTLDLPYHDFVPNAVPIPIVIQGTDVFVRLSIPESSTTLYTLIELHSHMRIVDRKGQPIAHQTLFKHHEETLPIEKNAQKKRSRHWLDCWHAPLIDLQITYTYHPMPWVAKHWRFLPRSYISTPAATPSTELPPGPRSGGDVGVTFGATSPVLRPGTSKGGGSKRLSKRMSRAKVDPEEAILRGLRPEGGIASGPTADYLRLVGFDPSYMEPDLVEVSLRVPSSTVCLYGAVLRHFLHVKENYFGTFQIPANFEEGVFNASTSDAANENPARLVDPRDYRPFAVKVNLSLHNIQAHLLKHCCSTGPPCPTAFVDCIGFELDKHYDETRLQVLVAPIMIAVYDNCRDRPSDCQSLSEGTVVLQGLQVRGHAMFSHEDLPLDNETLEYGWLMEVTVGEITGQLTAVQLTTVIQCVQTFVFLVTDQENEIMPSRDYELCQHGYPQSLCPQWLYPHKCPCPTEAEVKYKFLRLSVDAVNVYFVESGTALNLNAEPIRLATCDLHGPNNKEGISAVVSRVSLMQYVRRMKPETEAERIVWLEAGSVCLGPILVNAGIALPLPDYRQWQDSFLRKHDRRTKRLWFLWPECLESVGDIARKCGCFGGCGFFGLNQSGRDFLVETRRTVSSEVLYPRRAVFPTPDQLGKGDSVGFGESLMDKEKLMFELHDPADCCEERTGMFLLKEKKFWPSFSPYKPVSSHDSDNASMQSMTQQLLTNTGDDGMGSMVPVLDDINLNNSNEEVDDQVPGVKRIISLSSLISDSGDSSESPSLNGSAGETPLLGEGTADQSHGPMEADGEEDWEDILAKYVDLRSQLSKHITESSLLRSAYERHLTRLECGQWGIGLRLRDFWTKCYQRRLPRFTVQQEGFSPRLMVVKPTQLRHGYHKEGVTSPEGFKANRSSSKDSQSSTTDSSARSTATVRLQGSVDLLLTPLLLECMQRYVEVVTPMLAHTHPSTVVDNLHFGCVQTTRERYKPINPTPGEAQAGVEEVTPPVVGKGKGQTPAQGGENVESEPTGIRRKSILQLAVSSLGHPEETQALTGRMSVAPAISPAPGIAVSPPVELPKSPLPAGEAGGTPGSGISSTISQRSGGYPGGREEDSSSPRVNRTQLAVSIERVNVCFLQLSAVEDVVHSDTITSGLYDLTCVSLLAICLDSASFEVLINQKREAISDFDSLNRQRSKARQHRHHQHKAENPLAFVASQPSPEGSAGDGGTSTSSSSGPRLPGGDPGRFHQEEAANEEEIGEESGEFRRTEELISNIEIQRIHGQLRRLTKESHFSSDILLTAIPFKQSKVFFGFDSDPGDILVSGSSGALGSKGRLEERSAGWIMFECGLERFTLACVRRRGFAEGVEDYAKLQEEEQHVKEECETGTPQQGKARPQPPGHPEAEDKTEQEPEKKRNAFLSRLHVKTVWLNFPAPKRLPNKRRIDITRSDWNLLSTATPTIKAWMNPSDRLIAASKQLKQQVDKRILAVMACLMTQAITKDSDDEDSPLEDRFYFTKSRSKEKGYKFYDAWRTPASRALRYEPTCQIFTVLRRYMEQRPTRVVDVERWLREDTLPQTVTLQRGILALTRDWRYFVDIDDQRPTLVPGGGAQAVPVGFTFGGSGVGNKGSGTGGSHVITGGPPEFDASILQEDETASVNMRTEDDPMLLEAGAADDTVDNPILRRFLRDANKPQDTTTALPPGVTEAGDLDNTENLYAWCARKQQSTSLERDRLLSTGGPSASMTNQFKQAVHLRAQFQYMEDAQKLFRPLLEAVGLHVKGIRRTTLMKKFGGFFSADGMLETFQIDIVQSEDNPLNETPERKAGRAGILDPGTLPDLSQSTFLCQRFASKINMRDVIGFERQRHADGRKIAQPDVSQVDIKPTTTQVNMLFHIDHIKQHVNMPLLRLVHQFVTMIYCARDTREELEKKRELYAIDFYRAHRKQDSKGSSNGTDTTGSTLKSKSSAHVRVSDETPSSGGTGGAGAGPESGTTGHTKSLNSSPIIDPQITEPMFAEFTEQQQREQGSAVGIHEDTPVCWRRLYKLVELCATVPETKTVVRKVPLTPGVNVATVPVVTQVMPTIDEEDGAASSARGGSRTGTTPSAPTSAAGGPAKKEHRRSWSAGAPRFFHPEDVEQGGNTPASPESVSSPDAGPDKGLDKLQTAQTPASDRSAVMQRFTYQWFHGERIPILVFATAKVRKMDMSAVLSELKLDAGVLNIHGSFTHMTKLKGRGNFTEKCSEHSLSAHCGDSEMLLREGTPPDTTDVVRVKGGRSHFMLSCERSKKGEKNSTVVRVGKIVVLIPHHPVKLHDMMQRSAKRLSSTMSEFMRSTPTSQHSMRANETFQAEEAFQYPGLQKSKIDDSRPLLVNLTGKAEGLNVTVALHPTLDAVYQIDPVFFVGKIGTNGHVDINLSEHSLSFKSSRPPHGFPRAVNIRLPRILVSISQRYAAAGPYLENQRKLTEGLTSEEGRYIDAYATVYTLEQTLTTDLLNYIMVVVKLFMKEINEIIQKMAGEEQVYRSPATSSGEAGTAGARPRESRDEGSVGGLNESRLLSRAARGDTLFTFRVKMVGVRLIATTKFGAVKLELLDIDVELSNRVLAAAAAGPEAGAQSKHGKDKRGRSLPRKQASAAPSADSIFIFAKINSINVELGQLDQDLLYNERMPEFKTLAFFKTSVALRSLLSAEMIPNNQGDQEAFLISLIRPIIWVKPSAFDRAILLWMLYKNEFENWNEQLRNLSAQVQTPTTGRTIPGGLRTNKAQAPGAAVAGPLSTLFLQLTVEDLGICLPTGLIQGQSLESDSRSALVLTLESSRISACFRGSLVSEGEFTGFCFRFDDEFNVGSDDWKPDTSRSHITVHSEDRVVIMNACVVPNGTFLVCSRTVAPKIRGNNPKWILNVVWKMCGLDVHLDVNIGRRLKVLFATLTSMTGYDSRVQGELLTPPVMETDTVILGAARSTTDGLDLREATSRLDSLIEVGEDPYDSDIRNIEYHRQHIQMLEAQVCQTYKRSKWNNLLRKNSNVPPLHGKMSVKRTGSTSGSTRIRKRSRHAESLSPRPTRTRASISQPTSKAPAEAPPIMETDGTQVSKPLVEDPKSNVSDDEEEGEWEDAVGDSPQLQRASVVRPGSLLLPGPEKRRSTSQPPSRSRYSRKESVYYDTFDDPTAAEEGEEEDDVIEPLETGRRRGGTDIDSAEPTIDLELDVKIHVDSGHCVLHPKVPKSAEERQQSVNKTSDRERMSNPNFLTTPSVDDQLVALLHRYKLFLTQSQKKTDITVFYLPAVDVKFHYNSKTETESSPASTMTSSSSSSQRNKWKRADLYAYCSLQKPKDLVVNPALLDFLEQALENIPILPTWKSDKDSETSSDLDSGNPLMSTTVETFPVDVVVHINVQPSTIRFTCLPNSQVQCLMSLPFLDLVFSTKRKGLDDPNAAAAPFQKARVSRTRSGRTLSATYSSAAATGEPLSEGGLCVSAVLKEFRISVFHPYGTSRGEGSWDSGKSDSLTLVVQNIRVNISRTRETTVVSLPSSGQQGGTLGSGTLPAPPPGQKASDSLCLNNNVRFSAVCDIGCAQFKYDTRRTLEILAIPNAWYRSKLARRVFLGEESGVMGPDGLQLDASHQSSSLASSETHLQPPDYQGGPLSAGPTVVGGPRTFHHRRMSSGDRHSLLKQRFPKTSIAFRFVEGARPPGTPPEAPFNRGRWEREGGGPGPGAGAGSSSAGAGASTSGEGGSRGGSMGVASWQTLLIFATNLNSLEVEMYMGSAMGITKLNVGQLHCYGRAMMDSCKRKNTSIGFGLASCAFTGESGIVGGEMSLVDVNSHLHIYEDPQAEPEHGLEVNLNGLELRLEYMTTNVLLGRISEVSLCLHDEWRLRDPNDAASGGPSAAHPSTVIVVVGEMKWDQLQLAIGRTTTPDLVKSIRKVKDYFQEQVREGRRSLLSSDWISLTSGVTQNPLLDCATDANEFINKIFQRHWQSVFSLAAASNLRLSNFTQPKQASAVSGGEETDANSGLNLKGSLQLSGHSLGVACFTGNFRSAPDWAVFNMQYPTVRFKTKAKRDLETADQLVHTKQVLSFDLGQQSQFKPQMAYVMKVKRGRENPTKNPVSPRISEWFEFAFKAADQTVVSFVKGNNPSLLQEIVHLTRFPDVFPDREVRTNPLRMPTEAEILFVLPSISLRLKTDHPQTIDPPKPDDPEPPRVQMRFQADFHGILHLGIIDVPWLPTLIRSYIDEKVNDPDDLDPDLSQRASTGSPIIHDMRQYDVVHWVLSPKCRWLLANNVGVPAFDKILEQIGFHKAKSTIPKWLQRGVMDHLDHVIALLVERVIKLMQESEDDDDDEDEEEENGRPDDLFDDVIRP